MQFKDSIRFNLSQIGLGEFGSSNCNNGEEYDA
jgi:hypothetical protein